MMKVSFTAKSASKFKVPLRNSILIVNSYIYKTILKLSYSTKFNQNFSYLVMLQMTRARKRGKTPASEMSSSPPAMINSSPAMTDIALT